MEENNRTSVKMMTQEMKAGFWPASRDFYWRWGGDRASICHWVQEGMGLWPAREPNCCRIKKDISAVLTGYYFLSELLTTQSTLVILIFFVAF